MDSELPANPYPINPKQELMFYVFFKESCPAEHVDKVLADFIQRVRDKPAHRRSEIAVWRGEYTNSRGVTMWSIGIPTGLPQGFYTILLEVVGQSDDYGCGPPTQNGCKPYLLLAQGQVWQFDARRPPLSEGTLTLAGGVLPVRYLPYVAATRKRKKASTEGFNEFFPALTDYLKDWQAQLTDSAFLNWPFVTKNFGTLLASNVGNLDYPVLRKLCQETLHIPVFEIPMAEHGRLVVRPKWESAQGGYTMSDFSVTAAINGQLTSTQKLLALGHELGHYVFHLPFYLFFVRLQAWVQQKAGAEALAATRLTTAWQPRYYSTTEQRADWMASYFVLPLDAAESAARKIFTGLPITATTYKYRWLRRLEEEGEDVPGSHIPQWIEAAEKMEARIAPAPYDAYAPLFERVAWCAFNRNQDEWLEQLRQQEQAVTEALDALEAEIKAGERASVPGASRTGQVYRRVAPDKVGATVWKWDAWDPVIVEPADGEAQGYIGLVQRWLTKSKQERVDWAPWHDPMNIAPGFVEDWLRTAQRRGLGLMLYPLDPLQRARIKGEDR